MGDRERSDRFSEAFDHSDELDVRPRASISPGKSTLTSRLAPAPQTNIVFRVADPATARALGRAMEPRDANGVTANASHAVARAESSSGSPLPDHVRGRFENSLGTDLSSVRVHTGSESATAAKAVGAKAYTTGQDIHFGEGQYNPTDPFGLHLLAHEVAHTVQQAGTTPTRQNKLEVSSAADSAELEADHAADAMVAGLTVPGGLTTAVQTVARKIYRYQEDIGSGQIQGAGDEAQANAMRAPLSIDQASVTADMNSCGELMTKIREHNKVIIKMEQDSDYDDVESRYAPLATNTATLTNLSVFADKLDVSNVDTAAFAVQYRLSFADYQRLKAEASEILASVGVESDDPLTATGDAFEVTDLKLDQNSVLFERFRNARNNLHTAGNQMNEKLKNCRGAANSLQGALYSLKASAAAAKGEEARAKLAAIRQQIADTAAGVGKVVKLASAVAGLAGGGGETNKLATPATTGGAVDIEAGRSGLRGKHTVYTEAEGTSKAALAKAMGTDLGSLMDGGGADALAEKLVTAIGEYANSEKINALNTSITQAKAAEESFKTAGQESTMVGHQSTLDGAKLGLKSAIKAFGDAKKEMSTAGQALIDDLNKKGDKKSKNQAKAVVFLTDADRFLAQVDNSIAVGENQQDNLKQAAEDRKKLRGTTSTLENEPNRTTQVYWECYHTKVPGRLWGTNDHYRIKKVSVEFNDPYGNPNQGGSGTVEGTGGAGDEVKRKLDVLKNAKIQVTNFRNKVQTSVGMDNPILNPT